MFPIGWNDDGRERDVMRTTTDDELRGAIGNVASNLPQQPSESSEGCCQSSFLSD